MERNGRGGAGCGGVGLKKQAVRVGWEGGSGRGSWAGSGGRREERQFGLEQAGTKRAGGVMGQAGGGSRPGLRWLGGFWAERDGSGRCRVNGPVGLGRLGGLGLVSRFRSS